MSISGVKPKSLSNILEIGFGNGNFLGFASQRYNNVVGIEANPLLVEKANENKISAFQSFNELNKQKFDLIVPLFSHKNFDLQVLESVVSYLIYSENASRVVKIREFYLASCCIDHLIHFLRRCRPKSRD